MAFGDSGKQRRLARLFHHSDGRAVILPIDDGLISGPGRPALRFYRHSSASSDQTRQTGYCCSLACSPGIGLRSVRWQRS